MSREGRAVLESSGLGRSGIFYQRSADMRYMGQGHEVSVPLPVGVLEEGHREQISETFERVYRSLYGRKGPDVPLEVINWRVVASGPLPNIEFRLPMGASAQKSAFKGSRQAYFPELGGFVETPVYDRYALAAGETFNGPAIVEERESTLIVNPRGRAKVDEHLNVIVEFADAP
jgi:N-methylhydantoinase A